MIGFILAAMKRHRKEFILMAVKENRSFLFMLQ
jgi:hypothetical protein